nr:uncharacterized protein LOC107450926 [Parasteatoda tepidariorum]
MSFRFLPFQLKDIHQENKVLQPNGISSDNKESCVILSDNSLLKSSLLFQAALSYASIGDQVIFICTGPFLAKPCPVSEMQTATPLTLECIKMVYISEPSGLLQYLCELHTKECLPCAVIVHDIHHYVSHYTEDTTKESSLIKLLAMLEDTAGFITRKKGDPCHRMVSLQKNFIPKNYFKRYFRERWDISLGEGAGEYFVTDNNVPAFRSTIHINENREIICDNIYRLPQAREVEIDSNEH